MASTTDTNMCANCGKGDEGVGILKACTACKLVKYCNRECQIAHRPQHKKACKKRAAELHDEELFIDPPPPDDCSICFLPMSHNNQTIFRPCCGKLVCDGCDFAVITKDVERGKREEEINMCPFCRTPSYLRSDEETVEGTKKLMEKGNANAFYALAGFYAFGTMGLPQDHIKSNELLLKAGELGCAEAYYNLGVNYNNGDGMDMDKKKAKYYYELAAMGGSVHARYNLSSMEGQAGNEQRAYKHVLIAAKAGDENSLDRVKGGFAAGSVTKDEYEQALRAYHERQLEAKSEARDKAAEDKSRYGF